MPAPSDGTKVRTTRRRNRSPITKHRVNQFVQNLPTTVLENEDRCRLVLAQVCRMLLDQAAGTKPPRKAEATPVSPSPTLCIDRARLPPRQRQTLDCLLRGDSEKQVALRLGVSRHTVHVYVKALYRRFAVCSRGELLARFVSAGAGAG